MVLGSRPRRKATGRHRRREALPVLTLTLGDDATKTAPTMAVATAVVHLDAQLQAVALAAALTTLTRPDPADPTAQKLQLQPHIGPGACGFKARPLLEQLVDLQLLSELGVAHLGQRRVALNERHGYAHRASSQLGGALSWLLLQPSEHGRCTASETNRAT